MKTSGVGDHVSIVEGRYAGRSGVVVRRRWEPDHIAGCIVQFDGSDDQVLCWESEVRAYCRFERRVKAHIHRSKTMGREVRRVPKDWDHPKNADGDYIALCDGSNFSKEVREWDETAAKWEERLRDDWKGGWQPLEDDEKSMTFEDWHGGRPRAEDYMPEWPEDQRTHLMMYENTSEGTPISPLFETPEELARWLADNNASAFGDMTAAYEQWLDMCKAGWAPSAVYDSSGMRSGVEAMGAPGESSSMTLPSVSRVERL